MKDKDKTKGQLNEEIINLRKKIYDLEIFKLTREHITQALIKNEEKLIESEKRCRMIFENANDGIIIHDTEGNIFDVNKHLYTRLGYSRDEMLKMTLNELVAPKFDKNISEYVMKLEKDGVALFESGDRRKDGSIMPVEVSARIIEYKGQKAILSVIRDITQRKMAEGLITTAMDEKDVLLHVIKNQAKWNIQALSVMIKYQSRKTRDKDTSQSLKNMNIRLESFAKIYEKIYQYKNYSRIDFSSFVKWQTKILFSQQKTGIANIVLKREVEDVYLDIHHAIPCGLIIQELVSNSLNHAFPEGRQGEITILMKQKKNGHTQLIIKDNGIGLPSGMDLFYAKAVGLRLVKDFVCQLDGTIHSNPSHGIQFTISF
ncbi:MAG: PAS domain S-box protein [Candidatus Aminicenantes bacterium]|nr:PAS domain S-box protein [Candidatus Aminicenantes bacterium]